MEKLDAAAIAFPGLEARVVDSCESTNSFLMREAAPPAALLLAAESQTGGRGRRGRRWHSAPGGITFSVARPVARPVRELAALSLVAGVATARALRGLGAQVSLKWPNDLLAAGAKLGGILVETRGASHAVIGIGINYRPDAGLRARVQRTVTSLQELVSPLPPRATFIRAIAQSLVAALDSFEHGGLDALRADWLALDAYAGTRLRVQLVNGRSVTGIAAGLAEDGALRLQTRGGLLSIRSGTVRLA
jgi:BirA family transcriptional regulator, biotin operon repressor / biotin---[acetyl-CoA-carboxylase] ligase